MLDYGLCNQTVTVYRMGDGEVLRQVIDGCHYAYEDRVKQEIPGGTPVRKFLLIVPGSIQRVFLGDRVVPGVGPKDVDWKTFLPINVPGLGIVAYVKTCRWGGDICHTEAGRE